MGSVPGLKFILNGLLRSNGGSFVIDGGKGRIAFRPRSAMA